VPVAINPPATRHFMKYRASKHRWGGVIFAGGIKTWMGCKARVYLFGCQKTERAAV